MQKIVWPVYVKLKRAQKSAETRDAQQYIVVQYYCTI